MGIKDLWGILTPYCETRSLFELEGKVIAIDLAGWVCESLNVVDYYVHPRQYLKNLFFRTCYLLLEGIIPLFVLEGEAPKLKHKVIATRNEIQFRGAKPKNQNEKSSKSNSSQEGKGRTRFNYVLKQCENLLKCMGLQCIEGPGEAEAYCAFLNKCGLVEGVVSQDSDCFAYGAVRVYRNFSVTSGTNSAGQGGSVDVYDMAKISEAMDFGRNKIIVMALLCGCDYCPDGVEGVGRDSVMKLLKKYKENEILSRIRSWREQNSNYTALEMRVNDKNICSNCGHLGKTQNHTKNGCSSCSTSKGCDSTLWKEQRLLIKAELAIRDKALSDPNFPSQEIIDEFLTEPTDQPKLNLKWNQPNLIKFIKSVGRLLQWTEIYCFQKFLPLLTRWQVRNFDENSKNWKQFLIPDFIKKKRVLKGIACYEIVWKDEKDFFSNLIPDEQIKAFIDENPKGIEYLWSTVEPKNEVEKSYPLLVENFIASKEKKKKPKNDCGTKKGRKKKTENDDGLNDMSAILNVTEEIDKNLKKKTKGTKKKPLPKGVQMITKFLLKNKENTPPSSISKNICSDNMMNNCSTPKTTNDINRDSFDLNNLNDDENDFNFSEIINSIISKPLSLRKFNGRTLKYDEIRTNKSISFMSTSKPQDDMALISLTKNKRNSSLVHSFDITTKRLHLHRSLDDIHCNSIQKENKSNNEIIELLSSDDEAEPNQVNNKFSPIVTHVDRFKKKIYKSNSAVENNGNVSYFFSGNCINDHGIDEFEKSLDFSFLRNSNSDSD